MPELNNEIMIDLESKYEIFKYSEHKNYETDVDPENNYYNDVVQTCRYCTEQQCYLQTLHITFDAIAISETWLDEETKVNYNITGYDAFHSQGFEKRWRCSYICDEAI